MSLTELSFYTRKYAPFAVIAIFLLLIVYYVIQLLLILITPPPAPQEVYINPRFGAIKKPALTNMVQFNPKTLILDTIEGKPVTATTSAKVYFVPPIVTSIRYRQKITAMARAMGFGDEDLVYQLIDDKVARFKNASAEANINITNYNFTYVYNVKQNPSVFENTTIPTKDQIEQYASDYLKSLDQYPEEFAKGKTNSIYMRYDTQTDALTIVNTPETANLVEVDFYKPDVEGAIPVVSPIYFNTKNYVVMAFHAGDYTVIKSQVNYFKKSEEIYGIYPIRSGNSAWSLLNSGAGYVVSYTPDATPVHITKMFLGYLDLESYEEYFQPVYVFLGDHNYVGYVPAVADNYFTK